MNQKGTVVKVQDDGMAVVLVPRASSCTGSCDGCGGCASLVKTIETEAINAVGAEAGDIVTLESDSKTIYMILLLVFICPMIGVVLFYLLTSLLTDSEALRALGAFFGLVFGGIGAFIYNGIVKRRGLPLVSIVGIDRAAQKG